MSNARGILRPDLRAGFVHAEAPELDRKLREGDGILWQGDPRLYLSIGVVQAERRAYVDELKRYVSKGEIVARCYEVRRHGEDGEDHLIGRWPVEQFDRILFDLAPMRLDSPGHVDALDAIDRHNAEMEKAASTRMKEVLFEGLEHGLKLAHDRHEGRNRFRGFPGQRDTARPEPEPVAATPTATPAEG